MVGGAKHFTGHHLTEQGKKAKISRKCTFDILADRDHDKIQSERHDMFKFVLVETLLNIAELGANSNYYVIFFIIIS